MVGHCFMKREGVDEYVRPYLFVFLKERNQYKSFFAYLFSFLYCCWARAATR